MSGLMHLIAVEPLLFDPGERMQRTEFLSKWERMRGLKHAELINGVVYMPPPVSLLHGRCHATLQGWAFAYTTRCRFLTTACDSTWLMLDDAPQPDVCIFRKPEYGGAVRLRDNLVEGAPELAIEVTRSSRSYDLGPKLDLYARAGVREYIAALVESQTVEWRVRGEDGSYSLLSPDAGGVLRSPQFPGLWLDQAALWSGDGARLLDVLASGLDSGEFAGFLSRFQPG